MLIVAVSDGETNNIIHVEYETGVTEQLLENDDRAHPFAVTYDPTTKIVYWSDYTYNVIRRYSLLWGNHSTVFHKSVIRHFPSCITNLSLH